MTDLYFMYGRVNGNASAAKRLFTRKNFLIEVSSFKLFKNLHQDFCESGSFETRQTRVSGKLS